MSEQRAVKHEMPSSRITVIPATLNLFTAQPLENSVKRRVAGYARVSSDRDEQKNSYAAQVNHYTTFIQSRKDWEFVKVYADEAITGTNTKKRDEFNEMIQAALKGEIDLIIAKSVSRFARNTVDSLVTIRKLKEKGIEVFFERENIYTLDSKGELLLTIMSSLAQEESRSISENVKWGKRNSFKEGRVSLPYKRFLGYRKGPDNLPEIVHEEAVIVRNIYRMFLDGKGPSSIARCLTEQGIPTPAGKSKWLPGVVESILSNEKYKGDALLQKTFCTDFLTKKLKVNEGEVPQYYVEKSHPAIIAPEIFDVVQVELQRRSQAGRRNRTPHCFSRRIICEECGEKFTSNTSNGVIIWKCDARHRRRSACATPSLRNDIIQRAFVQIFNRVLEEKDTIIEACEGILLDRCDISELLAQRSALRTELDDIRDLMQQHIRINATEALDQCAYQRQFDVYTSRHEGIQGQIAQVDVALEEMAAKQGKIKGYLELLREQGPVREFSEALWCGTVDKLLVGTNGLLRFVFKDGMVVEG